MTETRSTRRQKQAAATRQDILDAARKLFASKGYVHTSMAAIAKEANTAVQTIYDSVGPKHAIALELVRAGEAAAGVEEFSRDIKQARNPEEAVAMLVGLTRRFMENGSDLFIMMMNAAPTEPDVAAAWRTAHEHHRHGAQVVAGILGRMNALQPGVTVDQAADTIGMMSWGTNWLQLTRDFGWTLDAAEQWMIESLGRLLLKSDA